MRKKRIESILIYLSLVLLSGYLLAISSNSIQPVLHYSCLFLGYFILFVSSFNLFLWRLPFFKGWLVKKPDLNGTWISMIRSNWIYPETKKRGEAHQDYMSFWQTFFTIRGFLMTNISESQIDGAKLKREKNGIFSFSGIYYNNPKEPLAYDGQRHYGGIRIIQNAPQSFAGDYWTQAGTTGDIVLGRRINKLCISFLDCNSSFAEKSN